MEVVVSIGTGGCLGGIICVVAAAGGGGALGGGGGLKNMLAADVTKLMVEVNAPPSSSPSESYDDA